MSENPNRVFSDAELRAYLAGEANEDLRVAIDALLETNDALEVRLAALDDFFGAAMKPAFDVLLTYAPAADLTARLDAATTAAARTAPSSRNRRWALASMAASAAAAFGVGIFVGRGPLAPAPPLPPPDVPPPPARPPWLEAVAGYVRLYSTETFRAAPLSPAARARSLAALGEAVALDLAALATLDGLQFQRAEVLQLRGRPLGQIAYLDGQARPVAVCILVRPRPPSQSPGSPLNAPEPAFSADAIDDLKIIHWDMPPYGFLVIGQQDTATLRAWAEQVAAAV